MLVLGGRGGFSAICPTMWRTGCHLITGLKVRSWAINGRRPGATRISLTLQGKSLQSINSEASRSDSFSCIAGQRCKKVNPNELEVFVQLSEQPSALVTETTAKRQSLRVSGRRYSATSLALAACPQKMREGVSPSRCCPCCTGVDRLSCQWWGIWRICVNEEPNQGTKKRRSATCDLQRHRVFNSRLHHFRDSLCRVAELLEEALCATLEEHIMVFLHT